MWLKRTKEKKQKKDRKILRLLYPYDVGEKENIKRKEIFMCDTTSWGYLLADVLSPISPKYADRVAATRSLWNSLELQRQRQIYYTLKKQKERGDGIDENPYFAVNNCEPCPTNWNGRTGINDMMKNEKMVIAKYQGVYGTYTAFEAKLFEMTDISPLN